MIASTYSYLYENGFFEVFTRGVGAKMLIEPADPVSGILEPGLRWWHGERFAIGWKGHLYLPGHPAGAASVARLAQRLAAQPLTAVAKELCGAFGLFVHDRIGRTWQVMVDNAGLYKIFHDQQRVSTSFLQLIAASGTGIGHVEQEALVEYLAQGAVFGSGTVVRGIEKLRYNVVLETAPGGTGWQLTRKDLSFPAEDDSATVLAHFGDLGRSFEGAALSADVTGGFDTRLIVCLLHHQGLPFELAISGHPDSHDITIARQVAVLLERPLEITPHDVSRLEDELPEAFLEGDGQSDLRRFQRDRQFAYARLARGIQTIAHGGGGAHFKDFFSYQDFPRYNSGNANFERYYDLRIAPVRLPAAQLTAHSNEMFLRLRARSLARFAEHRAATNNESYDRATFFVRDPEGYGRTASDYINLGLDVAMPYLDYRNIQVSFRLSPWSRAMNGWHRRVLTEHNSKLAALPTSEGYTASSQLRYVPSNVAGFAGITLKRVARKLSQRLLGKSMFLQMGAFEADIPGFIDLLRATSHFADALAAMKKLEIIAPNVRPEEVRDIHVGRLLTAGMLVRHLEQGAQSGPLPLRRTEPAVLGGRCNRQHSTHL
jgi:hypothetical protein